MGVFEIIHIILSIVLGIIVWGMVKSNFSGFPILNLVVLLVCIVIASVILSVCGGIITTIFNIARMALTGGLD